MKKTTMLLSLALLTSWAFADESVKDYELEKVVISSTGFEQNADNNLRNVIIIYGKELQDKGYTSIEQALSRQAGIAFVRSGTGGNPSTNIDIRGQGDRANFAVKLMVDGILLNTLDNNRLHAAGVSISPLDSVAIEDVERIEIIPGGGAVLYGNGTRGGVINIITKKTKETQATVAIEERIFDNANNGTKLNFDLSYQFNPTLSFSTNIIGLNAKGYRKGDEDKGFYANSKLHFNFSDTQSFNLAFAYFKDDTKSTTALTKEQFDDNPTQKGASKNAFTINRPEFILEYKAQISRSFDMNLNAFWQRQNVQIDDGNEGYYSTGDFKDSVMGANLKGKWAYFEDSYLIFGYDFSRHNSKTHSQSARVGNVRSDDIKDTHSIFALDSHAFNEIFSLSGGVRYEYAYYLQKSSNTGGGGSSAYNNDFTNHSNNFALEFTPNLRYSNTGKIYAKYERGYISPTPYQYRQSRRVGNITQYSMNKDLESENYDTYELGLSDYLFGFNAVDLALYYTLSYDEITSRTSSSNPHTGGFGFYNLDKTSRYGLDLNLRQDFSRLSVYESLSFVDARIVGGDLDKKFIPLVSRLKISGGADYELFNDFIIFTTLTYASKSKEDANNLYSIGGYFIADLGLSYHLAKFSLFAGAKNIFDRKYVLSQTHSTTQNIVSTSILPADGRSYYVKFQYKF